MSRIGNKPITVPAGIDVTIDGQKITVKGPKGTLERTVNDNISIKLENGVIVVARPNDEKENRSLHGLTRTLINNMIEGVSNEFSKQLEINGVGYRAAKQGNKIVLTLGYSHPVEMVEPEGITYEVPNPNSIIVKGIDKELVGQMAAEIRSKRPPEVYRGKVLNMLMNILDVKKVKQVNRTSIKRKEKFLDD